MQQIGQKIRSFEYCDEKIKELPKWTKYLPNGFDDTLLCAGNRFRGGGTCRGDSGGPLLINVGNLDVTQQIGVLHGGLEQCNNKRYPAIYVRLDNPSIYQWLRSQIRVPNFWS